MSRRRRKRSRLWLWMIGAVVGGSAAYFLAARGRQGSAIPVPGESPRGATARTADEDIRPAEREALDKLLRERATSR